MAGRGLRPLERVVVRLADEGMSSSEIAWRFRRSPGHIERVLQLSRMPRTGGAEVGTAEPDLRPVERLVMRARGNGVQTAEIAARMRRSPEFIDRVVELAALRGGAPGRR